ncbi:MAG: hypothetical protein P8Y44_08475 [Acidobacteriota bacterium]
MLCGSFVLLACGGSESPSNTSSDSGVSQPAGSTVDQSSPTASSKAATAEPTKRDDNRYGEPLENPERYYGLYANPQTPDRQWFISEARRPKEAEQAPEVPPGHLALGAMFGDVAPWHLKTISSTEFEQAWVPDYQPDPVRIEFELDGDGSVVAFTFTDEQNASQGRLERQGDLPPDWQ